ncbi:hypothetical protein B0H19DRAFT_596820 [Mycena capillaripes]|nr:hypothetical protein B0H19DRAFT_596820 [Mycena capillaripes]
MASSDGSAPPPSSSSSVALFPSSSFPDFPSAPFPNFPSAPFPNFPSASFPDFPSASFPNFPSSSFSSFPSSSSAAFSSSAPLSSPHAFFSLPSASNISSASKTFTSSPSPSNTTSPSVAAKKKNPAGPVAGGLIAALLVLSPLALFLWRARRRRRNFALTDREKSLAADAPHPLSVDPTPNEATPAQQFSTLASGETRLSPPTQLVPRGILAAEEKARHTARIEQRIRVLTEEAEARGGTESVPETSGSPKPDQANAQLLEEIRMLRTQMSAIQQQQVQMQAVMDQGLPEYTADPS